MRKLICVLLVSLGSIAPALAEVNFSIGINVPVYPQLVQVPGYPVYYAPQLNANYFFYDGLYWVYDGENWYASQWYNGPWEFVAPEAVPLYILRVPVRYYHRPPGYFYAWSANAPPRWDQHWGRAWAERRRGWDRWNRSAVPPPAPLPTYQRQYAGNRYPRPDQQIVLQSQNYRYWPHDTVVQRYYRTQEAQAPQRQVQPPQYPSERRQYGGPPAAQYAQEAPRGRGYREDRATATTPPASVPPNTGMTSGQQQRLAREQAQQQAQQRQAEQAQQAQQQQAQQRQAQQAQWAQQREAQLQAQQAQLAQQRQQAWQAQQAQQRQAQQSQQGQQAQQAQQRQAQVQAQQAQAQQRQAQMQAQGQQRQAQVQQEAQQRAQERAQQQQARQQAQPQAQQQGQQQRAQRPDIVAQHQQEPPGQGRGQDKREQHEGGR